MQSGQQGQVEQSLGGFKNWIGKAGPDDTVSVAILALTKVGQLDRTYRERFIAQVTQDPAVIGLLDELKTPA